MAMFPFSHTVTKTVKYHLWRWTSTTDYIDNDSVIAYYDFDNSIYQAGEEAYEDCDLPEELARLLKQEEKVIQSNQESIEMVNIGTEDVKREVKIGADLEESMKVILIELLREYSNIFA